MQHKATQLKAQISQQATPKSSRLPAGNKTSQQAKALKQRPSCGGHCLATLVTVPMILFTPQRWNGPSRKTFG